MVNGKQTVEQWNDKQNANSRRLNMYWDVDRNPNEDDSGCYVLLTKDNKIICRTQCLNPSEELPRHWNVRNIVARSKILLDGMSYCVLRPAPECSRDQNEWHRFLSYLQSRDMVAVSKYNFCEFYIFPPDQASNCAHVKVAYRMEKTCNASNGQGQGELDEACQIVRPNATKADIYGSLTLPVQMVKESAGIKSASMQANVSATSEDNFGHFHKFSPIVGDHVASECTIETSSNPQFCAVKQDGPLEKNFVRADPSYLQTLGQAHSGWIFGAIAELVDNSRDAQATKLEISIEMIYFKKAGKDIPMLSVIDDGHGMTHQELVRMTYFGHKQPDTDDQNRIGRFGVGFKTGAMRLGKDALVLTQTADSRSIAFLSQSLNQGNDNIEIPVVSYFRKGQFMELDTSIQSGATAKYYLKLIKAFSPFNKYLIGEKAGLFRDKCTGTQIYVWNMDEWGSDYCLEWHNGLNGGSSFYQGDILIRSRRIRSRPGQISQKVPLDYSLRSYLEVIFLVPRMRIYVQGSLVRSRPLAKSLNKTCIETGTVMGKTVHLTLGCSQLEWEQMNCGIFLYWHGRLIEAYKRVGGMIHNGDTGRGMIGVIDVTELMDDGKGRVWVHNNKQGFLDCEPYARLEEWLGRVADEYWDNNFDSLKLVQDGTLCKPDQEWVQCNKCRKWRMLSPGFDSTSLPVDWFCYMKPFEGLCETPEQKVDVGVVTVSAKRTGYNIKEKPPRFKDGATIKLEDTNNGDFVSSEVEKNVGRAMKRTRMGFPRSCKKV